MTKISIIVEYEALEHREGDLTALMKDHARRTLFEEEGCLRFEVLKPLDDAGTPIPNLLMVSELYADQAAVRAHRDNPRLEILRTTIGPLIKSRRLILSQLLAGQDDDAGLAPRELNASNDG